MLFPENDQGKCQPLIYSGGIHILARIIDTEYGLVSPAVFIPAAEEQGFIIPVGEAVLEQVFQFVAKHELNALGLSCIELNLSIAQCMDRSLPDKIRSLQEQYSVDPSKIILEITETTFENIGDVVMENVDKLLQMGYRFALDDYGIGYSNIQRINHLSLQYIKIDKSVIDDASSVNGRKILLHTVCMMQSIVMKALNELTSARELTPEEMEFVAGGSKAGANAFFGGVGDFLIGFLEGTHG